MKTPEEIKKGLETCIGKCTGNKPHCPYHYCGDGCMDSMNCDALALIQQLEAENAELKRERDAAVHDLANIHKCMSCKHSTKNGYVSNNCYDCVKFCNFEWRGPCEENGGQKEEEK